MRGKPAFATEIPYGLGLIPACAGKTKFVARVACRRSAHPRVCGENGINLSANGGAEGSSPRVRGKLLRGRNVLVHVGLIPACAGKTPRVRGKPSPKNTSNARSGLIPACAGKTKPCRSNGPAEGAHPRVCGENAIPSHHANGYPGSSPRVRGKLTVPRQAGKSFRLIPACAGKTNVLVLKLSHRGAHPRVCGENFLVSPYVERQLGSSPRVRGKLTRFTADDAGPGLIPACAGKTFPQRHRSNQPGAHPRVCGENGNKAGNGAQVAGSSPRVRGKRQQALQRLCEVGLIPACAGKTFVRVAASVDKRAHPRVCGENALCFLVDLVCQGSSPRVRGKRQLSPRISTVLRLIPACAGKTCSLIFLISSLRAHPRVCGENVLPVESAASSAAHPRVCGENKIRESARFRVAGSSPRVRGKPTIKHATCKACGLIPACAGKTKRETPWQVRLRAHPRVCGENTERSGVLTLRSVRSWKTLSFPSSLKVTHCRTFVQLSLSSIRL